MVLESLHDLHDLLGLLGLVAGRIVLLKDDGQLVKVPIVELDKADAVVRATCPDADATAA